VSGETAKGATSAFGVAFASERSERSKRYSHDTREEVDVLLEAIDGARQLFA